MEFHIQLHDHKSTGLLKPWLYDFYFLGSTIFTHVCSIHFPVSAVCGRQMFGTQDHLDLGSASSVQRASNTSGICVLCSRSYENMIVMTAAWLEIHLHNRLKHKILLNWAHNLNPLKCRVGAVASWYNWWSTSIRKSIDLNWTGLSTILEVVWHEHKLRKDASTSSPFV